MPLNEIKQGAKYVTSNEDKLKLYEQLANEYNAFLILLINDVALSLGSTFFAHPSQNKISSCV